METKTIKFLDPQDWRIVKSIHIEKQYGSRYMWAELVYMRSFTTNYGFQIKDKTTQDGIVYDYEKSYTNDEFDNMVLNVVKTEYPTAVLRSHELVTDMDIERFKCLYSSQLRDNAIICLNPGKLDIDNIPVGPSFLQFRIPLELYVPCKEFQMLFSNEGFFATYDNTKMAVLQVSLDGVRPTLHKLSELF